MLCFRNVKQFLRPIICASNHNPQRNIFFTPPEETPTLTTTEVIDKFYDVIGVSKEFTASSNLLEQRRRLIDLLPRDRNELPARRLKDSFISTIIPLKTDLVLREKYLSAFGTVRIGRLLEDLDVLAGYCCYQHILNPKSRGHPNPYSCVTALVDNIQFCSNFIKTDEDIRLSGHVSWVGKSSMEVSLLIDQRDDNGKWKKLTEALFVFVARDPMNQGPAFVNPLVTDTEEEKAFVLEGEERSRKRRLIASEALTNKPPNEEETGLIHNLFRAMTENNSNTKNIIPIPQNARKMADCHFNTLLLCHPQHRNRFNKIFGGFIMRQAFEIAYASCYLYSKAKPKVLYVDDILFRKPVEIGSLLTFNANVAYVEDQYIHIPVVAEVLKPESNERSVTNVFQFTFLALGDPPPVVLPNSYAEAMVYLDARRHFKEMMSGFKPSQPCG